MKGYSLRVNTSTVHLSPCDGENNLINTMRASYSIFVNLWGWSSSLTSGFSLSLRLSLIDFFLFFCFTLNVSAQCFSPHWVKLSIDFHWLHFQAFRQRGCLLDAMYEAALCLRASRFSDFKARLCINVVREVAVSSYYHKIKSPLRDPWWQRRWMIGPSTRFLTGEAVRRGLQTPLFCCRTRNCYVSEVKVRLLAAGRQCRNRGNATNSWHKVAAQVSGQPSFKVKKNNCGG